MGFSTVMEGPEIVERPLPDKDGDGAKQALARCGAVQPTLGSNSMRSLIVTGLAVLALGACGDGRDADEANQADLAVNDLMVENLDSANAAMNADMTNMSNEDHANMVMNDLTTNDADTNLANGL